MSSSVRSYLDEVNESEEFVQDGGRPAEDQLRERGPRGRVSGRQVQGAVLVGCEDLPTRVVDDQVVLEAPTLLSVRSQESDLSSLSTTEVWFRKLRGVFQLSIKRTEPFFLKVHSSV